MPAGSSSGGGGGGATARAVLTPYEPPRAPYQAPGGPAGRPLSFQFNPDSLTLGKGAGWVRHEAKGAREVGVPEFTGSQPRRLGVELFLDSTEAHDGSTQQNVETLISWCSPTARSMESDAPSAPWVKFTWGTFTTVSFFGYIEDVQATYSLFDPDGTPLRATCGITITEAAGPVLGQNPTSGALHARRVHRLVSGDSLESLAHREYGDPTAWRIIAQANGIDDPTRLPVGAQLLIPSAAEGAGAAESTGAVENAADGAGPGAAATRAAREGSPSPAPATGAAAGGTWRGAGTSFPTTAGA
jgi:nucleoid-associated protein YgaU